MNSHKKNMIREALKTSSIEDVARQYGFSADEIRKRFTPAGQSTFAVLSREKPIENLVDEHTKIIEGIQANFNKNQSASDPIPLPVTEVVVKSKSKKQTKSKDEIDWVRAGKLAVVTRRTNAARKLALQMNTPFDEVKVREVLMKELFPDGESIVEKVVKQVVEKVIKTPVKNTPVIHKEVKQRSFSLADLQKDPTIIPIKEEPASEDIILTSTLDRAYLIQMEKKLSAIRDEVCGMLTIVRKHINH